MFHIDYIVMAFVFQFSCYNLSLMRKVPKIIFGIWGFLSLALFVILFGSISYILSILFIKSENVHFFLLRMFSRLFLASCNIKVSIRGTDNIPDKVNFILISNYQTDLQHLAFIGYFPKRFRFIMSDILAKSPFMGHMLRSSGFITINDLVLQKTTGWERSYGITKAIHYLTSGDNIFIMPEGRASLKGEINPFNPGVVVMSYESSRPILPCATTGAIDVASTPDYSKIENIRNNMLLIFFIWISNLVRGLQSGNINIKIGKPVLIKDISSPQTEADKLKKIVQGLLRSES